MMQMETDVKPLKIRDLVEGYTHSHVGEIIGYNGRLNIRPSYQREYLHDKNQEFQRKLMESVYHARPINMVYFAKRERGEYEYELLDGQQRIITICKFIVDQTFHIFQGNNVKYWDDVPKWKQKEIYNYELMVCFCTGEDDELIEWFKTINTGSHKLSDQELRNAVYSGEWVSDAKRFFTSNGNRDRWCRRYMLGDRKRQHHLERIIEWRTGSRDEESICTYMAAHRSNASARHLWEYFKEIAEWIESLFWADYSDLCLLECNVDSEGNVVKETHFKNSLKGRDWGRIYREYGDIEHDPEYTKKRQIKLLADIEVKRKKGVYEYILSGEVQEKRRLLNLRTFNVDMKKEKWQEQGKKCANCEEALRFDDAEADHRKPWSEGGKTERKNLDVLCAICHGKKTARQRRAARKLLPD